MTELHTRIAALSPRRRELLEQRLASRLAHEPSADDRITPRDRSRPTPLSIQQQREWAFGHFRGANNIIGSFRVDGEFDRELISRALTEVTERHEVLRSTFDEQPDGTRLQIVHSVSPVLVPVEDISHLSEDEQQSEIRRRWEAEVVTPFGADHRQRLRISLLYLAPSRHAVLITTDHSAGDLVSMGLLVQEFAALYGLYKTGCGGLAPVGVQYGDFAVWQRRFEGDRLDAEREHWRRTLEGVPAGLALPSDRPYPAAPTFDGGELERELPPDLAVALRPFAESERASLGVVLCAASAVLLYRYTGRDDLVIGEILFGRNRSEIERTIGCFVGALPLRMGVSGMQTLREVVQAARSTVVTAYAHQDLPVDAMLDQLDLGPGASVSSLIDMWLDVRTAPTKLEVPGLKIVPDPMRSNRAPSPLTLGASPDGDGLSLQWLYMTELFDHATVVLLAEQFECILREIVTAPETTVDGVALTAGMQTAVTEPGRDAGAPTFVELFTRRVAQAPHASAVICDGVAISYAELDREADLLARRLRSRGVVQDTRVGILLDRSPQLLTAILGVLKSGGAYVPLDTAYPPARSAGVLTDADVRVLITHSRHASVFADAGLPSPCPQTLLLDAPAAAVQDNHEPLALPTPNSLAYVVYTSGSTGRPKGAMIEHGSLAIFARDVQERLGLGSGDRFLQFASPGFDVLAEEVFPVWLAGGCVVVPARSLTTGEDDITELVRRERLTVMELPTAYWQEWVRELDRLGGELPDCLRMVIIGGERVLPERIDLWRRYGIPLVHCYGLTETTVTSTFFRMDPGDPTASWPNFPIGTPIPSADLRVLDDGLRPVPAGAAGELYIGGVSLARGYLTRPTLTAERFVADPVVPGQRLYRTGDLVRRRADGNLEFLSRVDTQIKIRGYRIEPTEIESVLDRHPQVEESVVTTLEPTPGDRRLVGYVVVGTGETLDVADLRRHLERELPAYMVPSEFVALAALPLSSNGKVDRNALPASDDRRQEVSEEYAAPQTPVQELLASTVADVLGVERIGIHDNFFEIGGDSILAIQVVARAAERGLKLTPFDVFSKPTVAALSDVAAVGPVIDAEQGDVSGPVPLAPSQRWLCTAGVADPQHWNVSAVLELTAPAHPDQVRTAVEKLMVHHDGLRQRILVAGERTRVRVAPRGDATPFEIHDLADFGDAAQDVRLRELIAVMQGGLGLAVGPLVRVGLFRLGRHLDRLVVVAHGLVADRPSLDILLDDLAATLAQLRDGAKIELPAKTTSWQSWARRLAQHVRSEEVQNQRAFWVDLVAGASGGLLADGPEPDGAGTVGSARSVSTLLTAAESDEMLHLPATLGCDTVDVLLAALGRSLSSWTGTDRIRVDLVRHERLQISEEVDLTRTVGRFEHVHPVVLACPTGEPAAAALRTVKEHLRSVPTNGIGWWLLRQDMEPVPDPAADLVFSYEPTAPIAERDGLLLVGPADETESPRNKRPYPLEVFVSVTDGVMTVRWTYDPMRHRPETVALVAEHYARELRTMIGLGRAGGAAAHVPSDFPLAHIDQAQLDELLNQL